MSTISLKQRIISRRLWCSDILKDSARDKVYALELAFYVAMRNYNRAMRNWNREHANWLGCFVGDTNIAQLVQNANTYTTQTLSVVKL